MTGIPHVFLMHFWISLAPEYNYQSWMLGAMVNVCDLVDPK